MTHVRFRMLIRDLEIVNVSGVVAEPGEMAEVIATALRTVAWREALQVTTRELGYRLDGDIRVEYVITRIPQ